MNYILSKKRRGKQIFPGLKKKLRVKFGNTISIWYILDGLKRFEKKPGIQSGSDYIPGYFF
jgi:hypothetical protein